MEGNGVLCYDISIVHHSEISGNMEMKLPSVSLELVKDDRIENWIMIIMRDYIKSYD